MFFDVQKGNTVCTPHGTTPASLPIREPEGALEASVFRPWLGSNL